ncbi:S8 family serine peptidase [Rugosimonospora acidiphila]|uniref:S8 family serine peptidase n=1 Tax=Rugosimonospora acidiphila TaxID=556531 RepID=A0ABP9SMS5_9ACTN
MTPLPAGKTYTVTLLTGDVVTVRTAASGCPQVTVAPAEPGRVVSRSCGPDGHVRVIPADAAGLIGKTLDPRLFDVTTLIQQGYDDAHMASLPVIVQQASGQAAAPLATSLGERRALPSIRATAGREPKRSPATRTGSGASPSAASSSAAGGSVSAGSAASRSTLSARLAGASHVWLDERVRASGMTGAWTSPATPPASTKPTAPVAATPVAAASLRPAATATGPKAPSSPVAADLTQVGAPKAWQAGYTGRGQTVAVLDTGIDATHPDLTGKVVASEDFTGSGDTVDRMGHGTHVAATIAGSGAASGGLHRGVAPDASLVIGKVLDDTGFGTDSGIIAGMQWAAPLASVVSMSLGGDYSDGTDPLSQALDALSAQYGTLFVVAAGNDGLYGDGTIETPGSAAAALTVGAVDGTDTLADFSSLGPDTGSEAPKPDIMAPGVDIVSARAAGTSIGTLIDANYTADSGTSMATPHVAGAAALLHQEHPDWSADQLKAALMDTAAPVHGGDLYGHGAGRVDIGAAIGTPMVGAATVNLGTLSYPQTGTASARVTWANHGSRAATLKLGLTVTDRTGKAAPSGAVALSTGSVPVPAGGHASATVSLDEARLADRPGLYEGVLTARDGATVLHTPVAFFVEPPSYDLTITTTALPGTPDGALASDALVINLDEPSLFTNSVYTSGEPETLRVPAGDYSVIGDVWDTSASRDALAGASEVRVSGPTTVALDGARAKQVTATIAGVATQPQEVGIAAVQYGRTGPGFWTEPGAWGTAAASPPVFSTALSAVDVGTLHTYEVFGLRAPGTGPSPFLYDVARDLNGTVPADPSYVLSAAERARMARIDLTVHRPNIPDSGVSHQRYLEAAPDGVLIGQDGTDDVPASRVDYVTPGWPTVDEAYLTGTSPAAAASLLTETGRITYRPGVRASVDLFGQPLHPDWYDSTDPAPTSECVTSAPSRTRGNLHVELQSLTDSHERFNCMSSFWPVPASDAPTLSLSRDGQRLGSVNGFLGDFTVPAAAGSYALTLNEDASSLMPVSTRSTTTWTFRSAGPSGDGSIPLPLLSVDYGLPMDANNHPTGSQATFSVSQASGLSTQDITGMSVWTSTDDGTTWQPATVHRAAAARFAVTLPAASSGQAVSLRVSATGSAGSGIDQTIIRAYIAS